MSPTDRLRLASLPAALLTLLLSSGLYLPTEASASGAWLGITGERIDDAYRERENYWSQGLIVAEIAPGGPADRVGVQKGDIVVSVGSQVLKRPEDLERSEETLAPGRTVSLVVARNGGRWIRILNVEPGERPGTAHAAEVTKTEEEPEKLESDSSEAPSSDSTIPAAVEDDEAAPVPPVSGAPRTEAFGARCQPMNEGLAAALGVADPRGMLVLEVTPGGIADVAGVRAGDVITRIADLEIADGERLSHVLETCPRITSVRAWRQGSVRELKVTFPTRKALLARATAVAKVESATPEPEKAVATEPEKAAAPESAAEELAIPVTPPPSPEAEKLPDIAANPTPAPESQTPEVAEPKRDKGEEATTPDAAETRSPESLEDLQRMIRDLRDEVGRLRGEVKRLRTEMNGLKQI